VDSAWEHEKLEARKILENAAESRLSSARFVGLQFQNEQGIVDIQFYVFLQLTKRTMKVPPASMLCFSTSNELCAANVESPFVAMN